MIDGLATDMYFLFQAIQFSYSTLFETYIFEHCKNYKSDYLTYFCINLMMSIIKSHLLQLATEIL